MADQEDRGPVLYKCPYCVKGRFWDWDVAKQHIKENHNRGGNSRKRRPRTPVDDGLLDTASAGYNGNQESHFMAG